MACVVFPALLSNSVMLVTGWKTPLKAAWFCQLVRGCSAVKLINMLQKITYNNRSCRDHRTNRKHRQFGKTQNSIEYGHSKYFSYLLSVCPWLIIYFFDCSCPLLECPKQILLGLPISTSHRLPSTDQNWRCYWTLISPKNGCQRPYYSHFRENF